MSRATRVCLVLFMMSGSGCATARMIEARDGLSYGDRDPRRGGGYVTFLLTGDPARAEANRAHAYELMRRHCRGAFELEKEWVAPGDATAVGVATPVTAGISVVTASSSAPAERHLEFRCRPDAPSGAPVPVASRDLGK